MVGIWNARLSGRDAQRTLLDFYQSEAVQTTRQLASSLTPRNRKHNSQKNKALKGSGRDANAGALRTSSSIGSGLKPLSLSPDLSRRGDASGQYGGNGVTSTSLLSQCLPADIWAPTDLLVHLAGGKENKALFMKYYQLHHHH